MSKDTPEYSFSGYGGTALHSRSAESTGCRCNRFVPPVAATAASSANGRDGSAISSFANVAAARRQSTVLRTSQVAIPSIFWLVLNLSCFGPSRAERWIGAGSDMPNRRNSCDWLRIWSGCCRGRATTRDRSMNYRRPYFRWLSVSRRRGVAGTKCFRMFADVCWRRRWRFSPTRGRAPF